VTTSIATVPETRDRWAALFWFVVIAGMVVGFALGVREILDRPPVTLSDVRVGDVTTEGQKVQVLARNQSATSTYCVVVTIKAVDGDGLTLAEAVAEPRTGESRLEPGDSVNLAAVLTGLDSDEVDDYLAFVTDEQSC
jgi:hypothetical protein